MLERKILHVPLNEKYDEYCNSIEGQLEFFLSAGPIFPCSWFSSIFSGHIDLQSGNNRLSSTTILKRNKKTVITDNQSCWPKLPQIHVNCTG